MEVGGHRAGRSPLLSPGTVGPRHRASLSPGSPECSSPGQLYGKSMPLVALWGCDHPQCDQCHPMRLRSGRGALGAARRGEQSSEAGTPWGTPASRDSDTSCNRVTPLMVVGTAGSSCSVPSTPLSHPGSHRQSGPADRQHALPAPQAAEGAHGGRARAQRPAPPARLQGGVAAGPVQGRDANGCQRVPPPPRQGRLRCGGTAGVAPARQNPVVLCWWGHRGVAGQKASTSRTRDVTCSLLPTQDCSTTLGMAMKILATASWCPSMRPAPTPRRTACACSGCCGACSSAAPASTSSCSTCAARGELALATAWGQVATLGGPGTGVHVGAGSLGSRAGCPHGPIQITWLRLDVPKLHCRS